MLITVTHNDLLLPFEVAPDQTIRYIATTIAAIINVPEAQFDIAFEGRLLPLTASIQSLGIKEHDVFLVVPKQSSQRATPSISPSILSNALANIQVPVPVPTDPSEPVPAISSDMLQQMVSQINTAPQQQARRGPTAEEVRNHYRANPHALLQLQNQNPPLAEAVRNEDMATLERLLREQQAERERQSRQRREEMARLNASPFDPESQKRIEELIRLEQVKKNMEKAFEVNPESFGQVVMLYVDVEVNGHHIKAFVDSGAQITLMSRKIAEKCGIMRLVDKRFCQTLVGVGSCQAIGRVHSADIAIGKSLYASSFTIVEDDGMEFLLGLDMLRKHRCCIDLGNNVLRIGDGLEEIPFLAEKDIPKSRRSNPLRSSASDTPTVEDPEDPMAISDDSSSAYSPEVIQSLQSLGNFTKEQVIDALRDCAGNENQAASQLLSSM